mgnify:CR=1 FL=1
MSKTVKGAVVNMISRKGRFLNESELSKRIDPNFIIPGLEAGQVGILSAPGATGKTIFSLELAFSLASGHTLFEQIPAKGARRVLFIELEETLTGIVNNFCIARGCFFDVPFPAENLYIWHDEEGILTLVDSKNKVVSSNVEWLKEMSRGMSLVIVDHLSRCHMSDENSSVPMTVLMNVFRQIGRETDTGFLLLHHTRKGSILNGEGNTAESARGSSAIVNCARLVMTLSKNGDDDDSLKLTWAKINGHRPIKPMLLCRSFDGRILPDYMAEDEVDVRIS